MGLFFPDNDLDSFSLVSFEGDLPKLGLFFPDINLDIFLDILSLVSFE